MSLRTSLRLAAGIVLALAGLIATAHAGKFNKVLSVGDASPGWAEIIGTDDARHALADFADKKALVVVFTCNHCPVAQACEERLIALQRDYGPRGVQLIAVNVNNLDEDKLEPMKTRAAERSYNFPYLYDPTQKIARDFGASVTPQVFVLDAQRRVAYMGALDDNALSPSEVQQQYVRDALDAVLAGKTPASGETKAKGCGIKYE